MDSAPKGLDIIRLSDQKNIDKWAMVVRGLNSDTATVIATFRILNRCLRIGQTDTDKLFEAIVKPTSISHHMLILLKLMEVSGYYLCKPGRRTTGTRKPISIWAGPSGRQENLKRCYDLQQWRQHLGHEPMQSNPFHITTTSYTSTMSTNTTYGGLLGFKSIWRTGGAYCGGNRLCWRYQKLTELVTSYFK